MKAFQIKTKKDWCIAFLFALLVVYGISTFFSFDFQCLLLRYGNPMLTNMNQPKSYGNVIFTILVMTVLTEVVWWKKKRSVRAKAAGAAAGAALAAAVLAGYFLSCSLIVSSIEHGDGVVTSISPWGRESDVSFTEGQRQEIKKLCEGLQPVSAGEQKQLEQEYLEAGGDIPDSAELIWITYPQRYGHMFDLMVCVDGERIFVKKGYDNRQRPIVTFFEDNGLCSYFSDRNRGCREGNRIL